MAAAISPSVFLTKVNSYIQSNSSLDSDIFYQPQDAISTVGTYKWFIGTAIFTLIAGIRLHQYFFIKDAPPKGLRKVPGPMSTLPWIGRAHGIDLKTPYFAYMKFVTDYGGICSSVIGGGTHIWVGDIQVAYELLCKKAKIYSSRPPTPAVPGSAHQGQYLPLMARDDHWRNQRKFVHTVLTQAANVDYHGYVTHEAKRFLYKLLKDPKDAYALTDRFCGRISARLGFGHPDSGAAHCKNAGEFIPNISPSGPLTNVLPFLAYFPEWMVPSIKSVRLRREQEEKLWKGLMAQVRKEMDLGNAPVSYARTYFERKEAETGSRAFGFDDHEAAYAVGMLVTVAIFTIGGPLYCFFLVCVLFPEWQEKVRQEVEEAIGDRVLKVTDSPKLPILRAVIRECVRWRPPVGLGVPRLLEEDDEWNGYYLPKGAVIHAVDLAMCRDARAYPDPDNFHPERWLEPEWPTYKEPLTEYPRLMGHHGFGMGQRMCPGIELTEAELLVACGSIVSAFEFSPVKDASGKECPPPNWNWSRWLIGGPKPFKMEIKVRSAKIADRIVRDYEESVAAEEAGKDLN